MDRCYYDNSFCAGELWQCLTCEEEFCEQHWHQTSKGRDVECVACEYNRRVLERQEQEALNKTPLDRALLLLKCFSEMDKEIVPVVPSKTADCYEDLCNDAIKLIEEVECQEIPF